jgi:hypothetical protein
LLMYSIHPEQATTNEKNWCLTAIFVVLYLQIQGNCPFPGKRCGQRRGVRAQVRYSNRHPEKILGRPVHGSASKGSCSERGEGCWGIDLVVSKERTDSKT